MRKALFILSILSDTDIDWLAATGSREDCRKGTVLVQEGELADSLYVLLSGELSVLVSSRGDEVINTLLPGEVVGELSFLDSRPPAASVMASTDATMLSVSRDRLKLKLESDLGFASRFYRALGVFLAHRLRQTVALDTAGGASAPLRVDQPEPEEIDPELLDSISLAGRRFDYLLERVGGA